ncbi:MAG: glycosyltransferase family 9 protein [Planctomycetota bacterium]
MPTTKNILVVRLGGIGDVTIITPALKALKELYPQSRISLMTNRNSAEVVSGAPPLSTEAGAPSPQQMVRGAPYVDDIIAFTGLFSTQSVFDFLKPAVLYQLLRLVILMLKQDFDIFISLHNMVSWPAVVKPWILAILSQAPVRAGFNTCNRGFFLNVRTPDDSNKHLMLRCLDVIKQLASHSKINYTLQQPTPEVWLNDKDLKYADDFIASNNIKPTDFLVGIHPGGNPRTYKTQCWPAERFAQVANAVADKYGAPRPVPCGEGALAPVDKGGARILLTGGKSDRHIIDKIIPMLKCPPVLLPENISVKQLSAIIGRCKLFISNDTGPMHLAVAMKVPTIGIFGGGDFGIYGNYPSETGFIAVRKNLPCSPCYHKIKCPTPECLDKITVEEVLQAVDKQLRIINKNG